ncbi:hypothetical protein M1M40_gp43 [Halorubrum tailed virus 29]|uniref:Uncharacterized protein n=1 Tax=Halorubrum tailed virus 29 TaxID=2878010 RepID=A0AAE9BZJ5_9CAUD|nr:hypothetical protein M1M40_gp43 [Halorubrum tailed virus 29]UBF23321.1 hypothetical protein HRTV-29_gp43 [Halorubrum tailed virus 29]
MPEFTPAGVAPASGEVPRRNGEPTLTELPVEESTGTRRGLLYIDVSVNIVKVTIPDGSGGVATGTVVDLSGSVSL